MSCTIYPDIPPQPASTLVKNIIGWNGGAVSGNQVAGNLHAVFSLPSVVGVVCGFAAIASPEGIPQFITHGFYFQKNGGEDLAVIVEGGVTVGSSFIRDITDTFEIRRVFDSVQYFYNGVLLYRSQVRSNGTLNLSACLYMTGDAVG